MSNHFRMYEQPFPAVDELVMAQVVRITAESVFVKLLEYDDIEGMIQLSELSRRRIRSIHQLVQVNKVEVLTVLRVDADKGYVDLSKKLVTKADISKAEERYAKSRAVHSVFKRTSAVHGLALSALYHAIGWDMARKHGHAYDALRLVATKEETTPPARVSELLLPYASATISEDTLYTLEQHARRLFVVKPCNLRVTLELTCFAFEGIEAIRKALQAAEDKSIPATDKSAGITIKANLVAPPTYLLTTTTTERDRGIELLNDAAACVQRTITELQGECMIKEAAHVVNEKDDHAMAALMAALVQQQHPVSGDHDDDEEDDADCA